MGRGRLYTYCYTVTTRMTAALRWAAMRAILMFHYVMERWNVEQDSDPGSGVGQKWRPQQAYGSYQVLLSQPQTIFSTHTKSSRSRIDKRMARATGNTRYRYSKIAPLDHKMADNCVSLARTTTVSSTIIKPIKT